MANFAELDQNNKVINVVVVGNDIPTSNGPLGENDMHPDGEAWCVQFFKGGIWKQTSLSGKFRKQLAGKDSTYDPINDVFIKPKPFESWSLDSNFDWKSPVTKPIIDPNNESLKYEPEWKENIQKWSYFDSSNLEWLWDGNSWAQQ